MSDLLEPLPDDRADGTASAIDQPSTPAAAAPPAEPDPTAFIDFYRSETGRLVAFLLYMGASLADATDLAQDTMIDAYRDWASLKYPRAWTRKVASRKYGRHMASAEPPPVSLAGENPLLPAHHDVIDFDQRHQILRLLARLPWRQRQVMAWTFDGYQPQEIAAELNITPEAVRSSLRLARRALAAHLDQDGDTPR
jgi:RNA polymerase sigma-70 factor (ECF subfamily)